MSRWVAVHRHSGVGPADGAPLHGRAGPTAERAMARVPGGAWQRAGQPRSGEAAPLPPCAPGQLTAKDACSATMGARSHTCFCLLSTHCRSIATPCSRALLEGGHPRRLIQATVFSLSVLHSAADACC
jgi:hypothetical protein